jgi:hypothetical protein
MRGEVLRSKSNPSVSELLARRALEVPKSDPNSYDIASACAMGLKLEAWDSMAAGPVLKTLSNRCRTVMEYSGQQLGGLLARLALARAQAGDTNAFNDYADWLPTSTPEQMGFSISENLAPLEKYPTNSVLQSAADKMFATTNSAWGRLPWQNTGSDNPASSGLVKVPAFRLLLVRELDRKEVCGSISWQTTGMVKYSISNYQSGGFGYNFPEAKQTTNGTSAQLRWCDWIALSLSSGKRITPFDPFLTFEKRDESIENVKLLLMQWYSISY